MEEKFYQIKEKKVEKKFQNKRFFLPKKMKLKIKNLFFKKKKKYKYFSINIKLNKLYYPRIGILIKKKNIKYSVKRNKIRRIIYETFRLKQHKIKNIDFLLNINKNTLYLKKKYIFFKNIWKKYYK